MKCRAWPTLLLVLLAFLVSSASGDDFRTLTGEYIVGEGEDPEALNAIFTSTGDGAWNVEFYFDFQGQPHVFRGTAEGSLSEGELSGTVQNESEQRTFSFTGDFRDGQFNGTHAEVEDGFEEPTGTLSLREP